MYTRNQLISSSSLSPTPLVIPSLGSPKETEDSSSSKIKFIRIKKIKYKCERIDNTSEDSDTYDEGNLFDPSTVPEANNAKKCDSSNDILRKVTPPLLSTTPTSNAALSQKMTYEQPSYAYAQTSNYTTSTSATGEPILPIDYLMADDYQSYYQGSVNKYKRGNYSLADYYTPVKTQSHMTTMPHKNSSLFQHLSDSHEDTHFSYRPQPALVEQQNNRSKSNEVKNIIHDLIQVAKEEKVAQEKEAEKTRLSVKSLPRMKTPHFPMEPSFKVRLSQQDSGIFNTAPYTSKKSDTLITKEVDSTKTKQQKEEREENLRAQKILQDLISLKKQQKATSIRNTGGAQTRPVAEFKLPPRYVLTKVTRHIETTIIREKIGRCVIPRA